jgi:hypothetical protein
MIHYSAWIAKRWDDPSFPAMFPDFGTDKWWHGEIEAIDRSMNPIISEAFHE